MPTRLASAAFSNAYLILSLTALFWAGNFVVGRGVHGHVPPIALAWCRWMLASLILLPFAAQHVRRDWPVVRANLPILIFLGITSVACFNTFLYIGLNQTTAINGLVLQSSGPVLIVLCTFLIFGDRLGGLQAAGIAVSLAGVLTVVLRGNLAKLATLTLNRGDIWIVAALTLWAVYTAYLRKRPEIHWLTFAAVTFFIGAVSITPFFAAEHLSGWQLQPTRQTVLAVAYVSIFPGVLAYIFFNRGVELIGANRAGVCLHLVPFFGAILAITLLGEDLHLFHMIGLALILLGVTIAVRKT